MVPGVSYVWAVNGVPDSNPGVRVWKGLLRSHSATWLITTKVCVWKCSLDSGRAGMALRGRCLCG